MLIHPARACKGWRGPFIKVVFDPRFDNVVMGFIVLNGKHTQKDPLSPMSPK